MFYSCNTEVFPVCFWAKSLEIEYKTICIHVKHGEHLVLWQSSWAGMLPSRYALGFLRSRNYNSPSGYHFPLTPCGFPGIHARATQWPVFWLNCFWEWRVVCWQSPQSHLPTRKFTEKMPQGILSLKVQTYYKLAPLFPLLSAFFILHKWKHLFWDCIWFLGCVSEVKIGIWIINMAL